jgi:hypothetical protein
MKSTLEVSKKILSGKIEHPFAIMVALSVAIEKDKIAAQKAANL